MSCRKRCKRQIFKCAHYLFRFITGTLNTGKVYGGLDRVQSQFSPSGQGPDSLLVLVIGTGVFLAFVMCTVS